MHALRRVRTFTQGSIVLVPIVAGFSGAEKLVWFNVKMVTCRVMSR